MITITYGKKADIQYFLCYIYFVTVTAGLLVGFKHLL